MQSEKSKTVTTTKPATQGAGKHGKALEARAHHAAMQRRTMAADEEKKEKEAHVKTMRERAAHHDHDKT